MPYLLDYSKERLCCDILKDKNMRRFLSNKNKDISCYMKI